MSVPKHHNGFYIREDVHMPAFARWWWTGPGGLDIECCGYGYTEQSCRDQIDEYLEEQRLLRETQGIREQGVRR